MKFHFRVVAVAALTEDHCRALLDRAVSEAKIQQAKIALLRSGAAVAILKREPKLLQWSLCLDGRYRPVWGGMTLEISDELYAARDAVERSSLSERLRALREEYVHAN